jgi:hypothetical protein
VVVTDSTGNRVAEASLANDRSSFQEFFGYSSEPVKAVVEAGRPWGVIYNLLESIGVASVVANPLKTRAIAEAKIKTDTIDARTLADLLRAGLIPLVHVHSAMEYPLNSPTKPPQSFIRPSLMPSFTMSIIGFQAHWMMNATSRDNNAGDYVLSCL